MKARRRGDPGDERTELDHPLIREYLRTLDAALAELRPEQARELREQITAHLDDQLAPDATDADVAQALRRLGTPSEVAAEAGGSPPAVPTATDVRRWMRVAIRRRTRRFWVILSAAAVVVGVVAGFVVSIETAPALAVSGSEGWWYQADAQHVTTTTADGVTQITVPVRWHQRQGFYVQIVNTSGWTQTVLGLVPGGPQGLDSDSGQLEISVPFDAHNYCPGNPRTVRYTLPFSIPPGQSRYLRLMWTSKLCMAQGGAGGTDQLSLRVRVGWLTRTEVMPLGQGWYVSGTKQSTCS